MSPDLGAERRRAEKNLMTMGNLSATIRSMAAFLKREGGASAAEFAMVVLPMALITFAIMEVGSLMYVYNSMHNAVREAVRRAAEGAGAVSEAAAPRPPLLHLRLGLRGSAQQVDPQQHRDGGEQGDAGSRSLGHG